MVERWANLLAKNDTGRFSDAGCKRPQGAKLLPR